MPSVLFFNISIKKKLLYLSIGSLIMFSFFIYGNHSINKNNLVLNTENEKFNIKVISPNFKLEYGLDDKDIERAKRKKGGLTSELNNPAKGYTKGGMADYYKDLM